MALLTKQTYAPKKWSYTSLHGISEQTLQVHFGLYEGYVKNTNLLNEQIADVVASSGSKGADPKFAELQRRLGFEYSGMRLHEYYFDNLTPNGAGKPGSKLSTAINASFGDFEKWKSEFFAIGGMRGVGWAILYQDPTNGWLTNAWVTLHQEDALVGFNPVLVMDVWEHAFLLDYKPSERGKYIEAFYANLDWNAVEARLK
ncbi:MAG TPA: superoxide dismutase [Candidatus Dormibacteraeota bacterium]|nr:superoxide dismutase [Candidatus Dormibacteraeota bacterium]